MSTAGSSLGVRRQTSLRCILLLISAVDFFIPRFRKIFDEALPGQDLPALTLLIEKAQPFLSALSICWLIAGIWLLRRHQLPWLLAIFALILAQIAVTGFGLFLPFDHTTTGLNSASH